MMYNDGSSDLTVGFLHLDLFSFFQNDKQLLKARIKLIDEAIKREHCALEYALKNLKALLLAKIPHCLNEARQLLEKLNKDYPTNLNTIFHLEWVYRKLNWYMKSKLQKEKRINILKGFDRNSEKEKSTCLLEQGYVLLLEESVDRKDVAVRKIEEIFQLLHNEDTSHVHRLNSLAHGHLSDAWETLRPCIPSREERELTTSRLCENKLREGIREMNQSHQINIVWKYHLALACLKLEETLRTHNKVNENYKYYSSIKTDIISLFVEVVSTNSQNCQLSIKLYKERSITLLVEFLIRQQKKRKLKEIRWITTILENNQYTQDGKVILENPIRYLENSFPLLPNDEVTRIHYGRSLWLFSKGETESGKRVVLNKIEDVLSKNISIYSGKGTYLLGLSTRMRTRLDISYVSRNSGEKLDWLKKAHSDAIECCHLGGRPEDLIYLGKICFLLAVSNENDSICSESNSEYLHAAIEHYNNAKGFGGFTAFKALQGIGKCLYHLNDHRESIKFMKHAMLLSLDVQPRQNQISEKKKENNSLNGKPIPSRPENSKSSREKGENRWIRNTGNQEETDQYNASQLNDMNANIPTPNDLHQTNDNCVNVRNELLVNDEGSANVEITYGDGDANSNISKTDIKEKHILHITAIGQAKILGENEGNETYMAQDQNEEPDRKTFEKNSYDQRNKVRDRKTSTSLDATDNVNEKYKYNQRATECLKYCCESIIKVFRQNMQEGAVDNVSPKLDLLMAELRDIIVMGKLVHANIDDPIGHLCGLYFEEMRYLLSARLLSLQVKQHHEIAKISVKYLLRNCQDIDIERQIEELKTTINQCTPEENELNLGEKFKTDLHFPDGPEKYLKMEDELYEYDFFVSHSSKDSAWVKNFIIDPLETKLDEQDIRLKGCFADRDFRPGTTIISNIIQSVQKSYKIILVLTKDFVNSRWCEYETEQSLVDSFKRKEKNCIIPVIKDEDVRVPNSICNLTYADFSDLSEVWKGIHKLKTAIKGSASTNVDGN